MIQSCVCSHVAGNVELPDSLHVAAVVLHHAVHVHPDTVLPKIEFFFQKVYFLKVYVLMVHQLSIIDLLWTKYQEY